MSSAFLVFLIFNCYLCNTRQKHFQQHLNFRVMTDYRYNKDSTSIAGFLHTLQKNHRNHRS